MRKKGNFWLKDAKLILPVVVLALGLAIGFGALSPPASPTGAVAASGAGTDAIGWLSILAIIGAVAIFVYLAHFRWVDRA